jgi:uncharacterized protein with FMN-binding domain
MRQNKWRGTILFVVILTVMGATAGLKLYGVSATEGVSAVSTSASQSASAAPATPTPPSPTTSATPDAAQAATATPAPAPAAPSTSATVKGALEQTRWGPVQVALTFTGGKITAVSELRLPNGEGRSVEINNYAAPILEKEVLASQSAQIDTVSGATYTSDGYAQSVQSAIDQQKNG